MKAPYSILNGSACILVAGLCFSTINSSARGGGYLCAQAGLAQDAVSSNRESATKAIAQLRANGQIGVDAIFAMHKAEIERLRQFRASGLASGKSSRTTLEEVIDQVSQQRDAMYSQLYWYTDLNAAKQTAKSTNRPILSLRLLGNLTDEFSCANSRYFRTILYADAEVSRVLRESFVLHWESERPVPRVTIDFGDGHRLERTVTGNSVHYVLDSDGKVIDALPGLFAAKPFLQKLSSAHEVARQMASLGEADGAVLLRRYHADQLDGTLSRWNQDLVKLSKLVALKRISGDSIDNLNSLEQQRTSLEQITDEGTFASIAANRAAEFGISPSAQLAIASKAPTAEEASKAAVTKSVQETPLLRAMRNLHTSLARDSVRNDYLLHTRIHGWLASGTVPRDLPTLNQRVYAELFLTPRNDPWIGLDAPDGIAALENDGRVVPPHSDQR